MVNQATKAAIPIWPGLDKRDQLLVRKSASREAAERMITVQAMRAIREPGRVMKARLAQIERQKAWDARRRELEAALEALARKAEEESSTKG